MVTRARFGAVTPCSQDTVAISCLVKDLSFHEFLLLEHGYPIGQHIMFLRIPFHECLSNESWIYCIAVYIVLFILCGMHQHEVLRSFYGNRSPW